MYQPHPYANIFPMMSEAEKANLIRSMQEDGYDSTMPIVLHEGLILDGRNRYEAAQAAGVEPMFTTYEGTDALAFVIRHNLHRRHLNPSQLALIGDEIATLQVGNPNFTKNDDNDYCLNLSNSISQSKAAEMVGASRSNIQTARKLKQEAPELIPLIASGEMTLYEASKEVKKIVKDNKGSTSDIPKEDSDLIKKMKTGETVVINIDKNFHALKYAKDNDLYVQVDRWSDWGNPYLIGQDGDRDQVIESYQIYFARKFGLQKKLHTLKGKALGCHCYPERCHGDHLKALADGK
jgi:polyhydroxyalkanoate synthesis regulator phasin